MKKVFKTKYGIVVFCFAVCFLLFLSICVFFKMNSIEVEGLTICEQSEFVKKLDTRSLTGTTLEFCLRNKISHKKIMQVETYEVEYVNRHKVKVIVYEKLLTGCVLVMGKYMYFDKDGYIVGSGDSRPEYVPLIRGLEFSEISLYSKLKIKKEVLFDQILSMNKCLKKNEIDVDVIEFGDYYDVTLYIGDFVVLLGKHDAYDVPINDLKNLLDAAKGLKGTFDMTNYGTDKNVIFKEQKSETN